MTRLPDGHRDQVHCPGCREPLVGRPVEPISNPHHMVVMRHLDLSGEPLKDQPDRRVITQMSRATYDSQGGL